MASRSYPTSSRAQPTTTVEELNANLRECSRKGDPDLVEKLLSEGADPFEGDGEGKTALHYAAECEDEYLACIIIKRLLRDDTNWEKASGDMYGRSVLHLAAFLGRGQLTSDLSSTTPLHVAAARGNRNMVKEMLSVKIPTEELRKYIAVPDVLGQTALHKATSGGHVEVVKMLLNKGAHPLKERDYDGRTALDFAAGVIAEDAVKIAELLLESCTNDDERSLLLFASTGGIRLRSNPSLDRYLKQERRKIMKSVGVENLLKVAARLGDIEMTREIITRGAKIALICDKDWIDTLSTEEEKQNARFVLESIDDYHLYAQLESDKPALRDTLGRSPLAIGLAALFLNPSVKSAINVGIIGEWGIGKSSVMLQTESILLKTAAQLAFTSPFQENNIFGVSESELTATGRAWRWKIANEIEVLDAEVIDGPLIIDYLFYPIKRLKNFIVKWILREESAPFTPKHLKKLTDFFENYQLQYSQLFKSVAVIDRRDLFDKEKDEYRKQTIGEMPLEEDPSHRTTHSILTIQYNAWHYRNETQAWAGLAVEITKELEAVMTVAQKLRTSWLYNWRNRRDSICLKVIFPFFLAVVVAIFLSAILWLVLGKAHDKDIKKLKYGGLPASIILVAWGLGKSIISFVKPISSQIENYIRLPDHNQNLGYHNKVISDINFLIEQLSYRPSWIWKVFAFIWCCVTLSWDENYIPGTKIPKMPPASKDDLRIIVFVDDLDRCEENVILQVLSAVHLVLATCEVNVIMSMENSIIQRAIKRKYGNMNSDASNRSNEELADKYLRKIVQLPLHLPDPSDKDSFGFLQSQLYMEYRPRNCVGEYSAYGHRKANPKFQIGTSLPEKSKLGRGKMKKNLAEPGARQQNALNISDMVQQGLERSEQKETIEKAEEASGIEEATSETSGLEQSTITIDEEDAGDREQPSLCSIINALLVLKYTPGEMEAFCYLRTRSVRSKIPREWKCLMAYHRLAWTISYLTFELGYVDPVEGWKVQLIAWIFICWEWRDLITTLIQKWKKLEFLRNWKREKRPSLGEIVEHYIHERWPTNKKSRIEKEEETTDSLNNAEEVEKTIDRLPDKREDTERDGYLKQILIEQKKMREDLTKVQKEMRDMMKMIEKNILQQGTTINESQSIIIKKFLVDGESKEGESSLQQYTTADDREEWRRLRDTLRRYNVSMDAIQSFQNFRFNCEPEHLPWPLPEQD